MMSATINSSPGFPAWATGGEAAMPGASADPHVRGVGAGGCRGRPFIHGLFLWRPPRRTLAAARIRASRLVEIRLIGRGLLQRREADLLLCERFLQLAPQCAQMLQIATLAANGGFDLPIALCQMDKEFGLRVRP